jgi:hypothetical protein
MTGLPTKADCEAVRAQVLSIKGKVDNCSYYYVCGPCTGRDIASATGGSISGNISGGTNLTGTNQGDPFQTTNPYDAIEDAYEQKQLQNEKLLENGEPDRTITRDIPFDNAIAALVFINGRGVAKGDVLFDRRSGRAGEVGGFTIRPSRSSAPRYAGSQRGFDGGGISNLSYGDIEKHYEKFFDLKGDLADKNAIKIPFTSQPEWKKNMTTLIGDYIKETDGKKENELNKKINEEITRLENSGHSGDAEMATKIKTGKKNLDAAWNTYNTTIAQYNSNPENKGKPCEQCATDLASLKTAETNFTSIMDAN